MDMVQEVGVGSCIEQEKKEGGEKIEEEEGILKISTTTEVSIQLLVVY